MRSGGAARQNKKRRGESNMRKKSIPYRHFERKREISIAARKSASLCHFINEVLVLRFSAISYLLLTGVQERFLDYARNDDAREALSKLRGASIFLCAAPRFLISHFSFLIQSRLSSPIKGQHVPWATPKLLHIVKFFSLSFFFKGFMLK